MPKEPIRLCVSWGGGDANPWVGQLRLEQGSLADLKLLGSDPDAAGSIWLDSTGVQVHSLSAHKRDSFEVVANTDGDTNLAVQLAARSNAAVVQAQVSLAEVMRRPYLMRLDDRGNTLEIRAVTSPTLHVTIKNDPGGNALIFAPGSELSLELAAALPAPLHGTTVDVQTTLAPGRRKDGGSSFSQKLSVPVTGDARTTLSVPLSVPEGVYTVHISISRASGYLRDKFFAGASAPIAEQSFQIVVMNPQPIAETSVGRWESVLEIDPTNPRWVGRLPEWSQLRRIPGLYHGPLGDVRVGAVNLTLGRFVELPFTSGGSEAHWQAYSLPLEATGAPHLLEIDYPADEEQSLGLNIVEAGANGTIEGVRLGSCVYVEGLGRVEEKQKQVQRLIFWPKTQVPLLLVSNQHPQAAAHFGQIRVFKRIGPLNANAASPGRQKRLIAAYIGKPALVDYGNASAQELSGGQSAINSIDDYEAAYEYATRLSGYIRFAGYNSAVVNVMGEGAATLPCAKLTATLENDAGQTVDRCREADGLSIMLHVFDREGITLIPAIDFATPIPKLEALRRANPLNSGIELVGPEGQTWLDTYGTQGGVAPYYNILNPVVQQEMLNVVREIADRYGANSAFGGLAVQLNSNGYTQLPPLEWALDDSTMGRFSHDTGIQMPMAGDNRFAARRAALTGANADVWRVWRSNQIADFYHRMASVVAKNGNHKLILTTEKLFDHPVLQQRVRPDLMADNRVAQTLLEMGVDFTRLNQVPGLIVCPTRFVGSAMPLPDHAIDLELNASFSNLNRATKRTSEPSVLLYHHASPVRFASLDFGGSPRVAGDTRFMSEFVPSAVAARKPYVQSLADGNPSIFIDGGDYLPPTQEEATRGLRNLLSQLPTNARIEEVAKQPVIVRTYREQNQSTIVVINTAPWHVDAQITLDAPASVTMTPFPAADGVKIASENLTIGQQLKSVSLESYSVKAFQVSATGVKVVDVKASLDKPANDELKRGLEDLASRDLSAVHVYRGLSNPSFEPAGGGGTVPGWHLVRNSVTASVSLDPLSPQDGRTSLHIRSTGQIVAVESDPFPIPATGQLAMTVFARSVGAAPEAKIRLLFEAESKGLIWQQTASVNASEAERDKQQWGPPLAILDSNLPLDSQGKMRIRFEFAGAGDYWLDNIKLNDILWPLTKVYPNSSAEIVKLLQQTHDIQGAYDAGQLSDCLRLLDDYWPRFIMAYMTTGAPAIALAAEPSKPEIVPPKSATTSDIGETPAPGLGERIKHIVPVLR